MYTYKIGNINLALSGCQNEYILNEMKKYEHCCEKVHATIDIRFFNYTFPVPDDNIVAKWEYELWTSIDGFRSYYIFFPEVDGAVIKVDFDRDFKNIVFNAYDVRKNLGIDDSAYLFNTLSHIFHFVAMKNGSLVYHSSAISHNGRGIAFSADSGVGKSTHTSLWMKYIQNCEYINDDTPLIYKQDDKIYISGTPFSGTSGINNNFSVPLKAIVFLERGKKNYIEKIPSISALSLMMDQIKTPFDTELVDCALSVIGEILKDVPIYKLRCNMEPDAAFTSFKILE